MVENTIKERREALGVTQQWPAEKAGVTQSTISEVESGGEAKVMTGIKIVRALGSTVEELWCKDC